MPATRIRVQILQALSPTNPQPLSFLLIYFFSFDFSHTEFPGGFFFFWLPFWDNEIFVFKKKKKNKSQKGEKNLQHAPCCIIKRVEGMSENKTKVKGHHGADFRPFWEVQQSFP